MAGYQNNNNSFSIDGKEIVIRIIKYILEGAMVGVAAFLIPKNKPNLEEILTISLIAAATFSLLDMMSPSVGNASRIGFASSVGVSLTPLGQSFIK